jgi:hypothetical protein
MIHLDLGATSKKLEMVITWVIRSLTEPTEYAEKNKILCDLGGLCEITRKCLQLNKILTAEIRTNSQKPNGSGLLQ